MKANRLLILCLTIALSLGLISCGAIQTDDGKLNIVTTNFALYDLARAAGGEECNVHMLISPGSESHDFEATLSDMALIEKADIFVYVGGESEDWVEGLFNSMGESADKIKKIRAMDLVHIYTEEAVTGSFNDHDHDHDHDHEHDHGHGIADEHIWTSVPNAITVMERIAEEIRLADADVADAAQESYENYKNKLTQLHNEYTAALSDTSRSTVVVADRFPFRYLTEEYGLDYYAAFSGCSSDTEPTLSTVNFLVEKVRDENIPVVFIIEFSDGATAKAVANETGARIMTLHSAHNVTKAEFDSGITYAEIMAKNLEALKAALN